MELDYFAGLGCAFWSGKTPTDGGVAELAVGAADAGAAELAGGAELAGSAGGDGGEGASAGGAAGGGGSARSFAEVGSACAGLVPGAFTVSSMLCTWRVQSFWCSTSTVLTASGSPGSDARIDQCPSVSGA